MVEEGCQRGRERGLAGARLLRFGWLEWVTRANADCLFHRLAASPLVALFCVWERLGGFLPLGRR